LKTLAAIQHHPFQSGSGRRLGSLEQLFQSWKEGEPFLPLESIRPEVK
jgi:hypothetical protein